jgi:two-component sensor histidine kinase
MNKYVALNDSLTSFNISQLIAEYDIITKQEENNIAQEKAAFESQKAKSRANNLILISGLLLTIIGLLYLRNRSNKQANDILQSKNSIIEKSLSDKEILLKEIHHRVKNNLQIVSSMLNLQTRHINDPQVLEAITDSRNRVKSMALIHQNLYRQNNLKSIYISTYLHNLCASLFHSFKVDENRIKLTSNIEPLELDVDTIIPIGLIVNELITNAIKYAFPNNRQGEIELNVKLHGDHLFLQVRDNGIGLNPDFDYKKSDSFGYSLIHSLAGKLKAQISIISNDGTNAEFQIKNFKLISDEVS